MSEDLLSKVREAINKYHLALDKREHGSVAAHHALTEIQLILDMSWIAGKALHEERMKTAILENGLDAVLQKLFLREENPNPQNGPRFFLRCSHCDGTDLSRPKRTNPNLEAVKHLDGCLVPRLKTLALQGACLE